MRGIARLATALILAAGLLLGLPPGARADAHRDERLGWSLQVPAKWDAIPVAPGGFLAARFQSNREYEYIGARGSGWARQRPWIEVVVIPFPPKGDPGTAAAPPWKDLREYMDRALHARREGGYRFAEETTGTVGGRKVRMLEATLDLPAEGERRLFGWEFAGEDAYYGLVTEILVQEEKRLKQEVLGSFSTFRTFPRSGSLPGSPSPGEADAGGGKGDGSGEDAVEEAKRRREAAVARALESLREGLPKGWTITETANFAAVSHVDPKFTKEMLQHAEALRAWLEKEFGFIGSGHPGRILLRISADQVENEAVGKLRTWSWDAPEILTFKDRDGWFDRHIEDVNRGIYQVWMHDRNGRLLSCLPKWIEFGLSNHVEGARLKGGRLEFRADTWDSVEMKNLRRAEGLLTVRDFFTRTSTELWTADSAATQTQFFVQFLLGGAAARSPKLRPVFTDYLKNLIFLLDSEPDPAPPPGDGKGPPGEADAARREEELRQSWRSREREILDRLFEKTFSGWTDRDWDAFQSAYRQFLK